MALVERFLKYVSFDTQSSEETEVTPSTPGQMVFAKYLKEELESLGLEDITLDEHGYLFATLPANIDPNLKTLILLSDIWQIPFAPEYLESPLSLHWTGCRSLHTSKNVLLKP